jgi:hypothetical protein
VYPTTAYEWVNLRAELSFGDCHWGPSANQFPVKIALYFSQANQAFSTYLLETLHILGLLFSSIELISQPLICIKAAHFSEIQVGILPNNLDNEPTTIEDKCWKFFTHIPGSSIQVWCSSIPEIILYSQTTKLLSSV